MIEFDKPFIEELIGTARRKQLSKVRIKQNDRCIEIELGGTLSAPNQVIEKQNVEQSTWVTSTMVGYFRRNEKAVAIGSKVEPDSIIGTLEALGLPNDIPAGNDGVLESVIVNDGDAIEFGQRIARLKI